MSLVARLSVILALSAATLAVATSADACRFQTLYTFTGGADGENPEAGLVFDATGKLYGTTTFGAGIGCDEPGCGTVFKLNPTAHALTTLHAFADGADGGAPNGLVFDTTGELYGTTLYYGAGGVGTVFKLNPTTRALTTLHTFTGRADGGAPNGLVFGTTGTLYGTTSAGGTNGSGTVFKLNPTTHVLTTLYAFTGGADGGGPDGLVFDRRGELYGTTTGGTNGSGTVFKLNPTTHVLTTLYAFTGGADGGDPNGLVFDATGKLYGTTSAGGTNGCNNGFGCGTVFKLNPTTHVLTTLHTFTGGADGGGPTAGLVFDTTGVLYGTTWSGGARGFGTVFKLNPTTHVLTTLHTFTGGADGGGPDAALVFDTTGALYGTASFGGTNDSGTVFKLIP